VCFQGASGRKKPPEKELAGLRIQPLQIPTRHVHRDNPGCLVHYLFHGQSVNVAAKSWMKDPKNKEQLQCDEI